MPNRDKTGPDGKGSKTGRGCGPCGSEESSDDKTNNDSDAKKGLGPCGDGTPRGGGRGRRGQGQRRRANGITYYK